MDQHGLLREYVRMLISGDTNSLVVKGSGGIGKSYSIMDELDRAGLKESVNYVYVTGYVTPLQLFNIIGRSCGLEAPQLLVFDDIDALVTNRTSIALLKASLWETRGKRVVSYHSSSSKVEGSPSIEFEGKIILVLNDVRQEKAFGKPLLDRCTVFDMALSQKELIKYIDTILPNIQSPLLPKTKREIWKQIKMFSGNPRFSVRSLVRAFEFYRYSKSTWIPMFLSSLSLDSQQKIYYEIVADKNKSARTKAKEFATRTGKSTRQWYRVKKIDTLTINNHT